MSTTLLGLEVRSALLYANLALGTPTVLELFFQHRGSFKLTLRTVLSVFLQESGDVCCASRPVVVVVDSLRKSTEICFADLLCLRWGATDLLPDASGSGFSIKSIKHIEQGQISGGQL